MYKIDYHPYKDDELEATEPHERSATKIATFSISEIVGIAAAFLTQTFYADEPEEIVTITKDNEQLTISEILDETESLDIDCQPISYQSRVIITWRHCNNATTFQYDGDGFMSGFRMALAWIDAPLPLLEMVPAAPMEVILFNTKLNISKEIYAGILMGYHLNGKDIVLLASAGNLNCHMAPEVLDGMLEQHYYTTSPTMQYHFESLKVQFNSYNFIQGLITAYSWLRIPYTYHYFSDVRGVTYKINM